MSLRTFIIGLVASFGLAWVLVLVLPGLAMRQLEPVPFDAEADGMSGFFHPKRAGRTPDGALVYASNGCNQCHTQLVRPTYAGNDMFRDDWGGLAGDLDRGDTRRETNAFDFEGERHALVGVARIGPDLSNLGRRLDRDFGEDGPSREEWLLRHLYDPRLDRERWYSLCPPHPFLFRVEPVRGAVVTDAVRGVAPDGFQVVPRPEALALVSYLSNLRKDQQLPAAMIPPSETDFAAEAGDSDG